MLLPTINGVESANVHCYIGGGISPTNGSTLSFQNICVGNGSCFLIIANDYTWSAGCNSPYPASANVTFSNATDPYCPTNVTAPTFCRCGTNFCNTPNNPGFLSALNRTLSNIVKPADPGNLTCFECGSPYVNNLDGTRSVAPFNVTCDGSKFCTGKYCVTRKSQYPRSFCATSWEDPKAVQCQKVNEPYDAQECICTRNFCNYPYDPDNPPPTTTTTTTTTTTATTTTTVPPSPWQCFSNCSLSQLTLSPGISTSTDFIPSPTVSNVSAGCAQLMVTCQAQTPRSIIAFGGQGTLRAFRPNFTRVDSLLYCIKNNAGSMWTRFGTSEDSNAMITVSEVHCNKTLDQTVPVSNRTTNSTGGLLAVTPWQCQTPIPTPTNNGSFYGGTPGCAKMMITCNGTSSVVAVAFGRMGRLLSPSDPKIRSDALLYCLNNNGSLMWTRFGTSEDPNAMLQPVTEAHCDVITPPVTTTTTTTTTTAVPAVTTTTPTSATMTTTAVATTTAKGDSSVPPSPWQCAVGCNASQLKLGFGPDNGLSVSYWPFVAPAGCAKFMFICNSPSPMSVVGFGSLGNLSAQIPPYNHTEALLYCIQNGTSLLWTRFGTTKDPNALLQPVTEVRCMREPTTTSTPPPTTTTPPSTPPPTTLPPTTTTPPSTPPPTTLPPTTTTPPSTPPPTTLPPTTTTPPSTPPPTTLPPTTTTPPSTPPPTTLPPTTTTPPSTPPPTTLPPTTTTPPSTPPPTTLPPTTTTPPSTPPTTLPPTTTTPPSTPPPTTLPPTTTTPPSTPPPTTLPPTTTTPPLTTTPPSTPPPTTLPPATTTPPSIPPPTTLPPTTTTPLSTPPPTTTTPPSATTTIPPTTTKPPSPSPTTTPPATPPPTATTPPPTTTTLPSATTTTIPPTTIPPSTPSSAITTTTPPPTPPTTTSAYVITCPDGRQFGPNELAVYMGQILKQTILGTYKNAAGNAAVDSYQDGINTHICNYISGNGGRKRKQSKSNKTSKLNIFVSSPTARWPNQTTKTANHNQFLFICRARIVPMPSMQMLPAAILFHLFAVSAASHSLPPVVANTNYGPLRGFVHFLGDSSESVDVFLGVPYAAPPVEALRFEKPIPPQKWDDIRPAVEPAPACVPHARPFDGTSRAFAEDCLYLNLICPHKKNENASQLSPVLVIIHGGGFEIGSAHQYDFEDIGEKFVRRGIMVVVVQYRLGIFGFASSGDKTMPGNLGLWDLLAMLRWLRSEAKAFGGDAKRVTLLGFSAGSAAISALGMCPFARDLFQQAIQMSGSILAQTKTGAPVANETKILAQQLNCPTDESLELKECLREKTIDELHEAMEKIGPTRSDVNFCKFGPRFDGHFFPRDFPELIQESPPKRTILGFSQLESLIYTLLHLRNDTLTQYVVPKQKIATYGRVDFEAFVRDVVAKDKYFGQKAKQIQEEIIKFFGEEYEVPKKKDNAFWLQRYSLVLTDLHYIMPCVWESRLKLNLGWPIWLYENAYFDPSKMPDHVPVHAPFHGSDHDLMFINPSEKHLKLTEKSKQIVKVLVDVYANFVLKGQPQSELLVKWKMATLEEPMRHLFIDGPKPTMKETMELRRLKFWHTLTETHSEYNLIRGTFGHPTTGEHEEL
uniref:Carboxylesterase type B domain-containing protein n=1 Tax=Globodera rostochiensis TaxID=31243 RepID=A0A914HX89_GLORO